MKRECAISNLFCGMINCRSDLSRLDVFDCVSMKTLTVLRCICCIQVDIYVL
jgi:hypothetical protein